ncbi:MAG: FAD:protein FMN transferase [Eubacteriales bacterium]|jgi:thiamine biosynthesis lipoprotein|nr:FAD:protein FMN transferase [Eubacteriales bacterium]MDD4104725.1 FAD:protein FMN transferase [Eubacteriales bacterium]MDD4710305.1 FAD:protein FMN transferase [Eubacteriales bacterium]NLO15296.1 FAD:protein FMN transferase [Clostridiales bacterium]
MKRTLALFVCLLNLSAPLAIGETTHSKYSHSFFNTFDTVITIIGYARDKDIFDEVAAAAQEKFTYYHKMYDQYHAYEGVNNLYVVNREAHLSPVEVPEPLFDLILWCIQKQPDLAGTVNIAMGSVLDIWHDAREEAESIPPTFALPDMETLREAARHTAIDNVVLNEEEKTIFIKDPNLTLNLGAVAKGYAAEMVAEWMLESAMPSFIINAGGNIRTGNAPLDGRSAWGVAVQDPESMLGNTEQSSLDTLYLHDLSVVTSGDYQRFFTVNGKRYHHIISPQTLFPSEHMRAITVVTRHSGWADLLSTALFLMPYEEGADFVAGLEGVGAIWVLNDMSVMMSENLQQYSKAFGATPH